MQSETRVTQTIRRTRDAESFRLERPQGFDYLPGQWMFVTFASGSVQETKPLSLSSSPTEDFLEVTKRLTGHEFSNALAAAKVGDAVQIRGPYGNFTFQGEYNRVCMLSGGIGITPLRSMIKFSTDGGWEASISLLYSNRYEDSIPFADDLEDMQKLNPNFRAMYTVTKPSPGWRGLTGRINREMIESLVPDYKQRVHYLCGPGPMVDALKAVLSGMGIPEAQIKHEYFTGYIAAPARSD